MCVCDNIIYRFQQIIFNQNVHQMRLLPSHAIVNIVSLGESYIQELCQYPANPCGNTELVVLNNQSLLDTCSSLSSALYVDLVWGKVPMQKTLGDEGEVEPNFESGIHSTN